jgi:Mrp family chromosome partitioning ATPase
MPPWDPDHHLRLYADGLRERLITYFEVNDVNHKPKLVGVTSCGKGTGVTTLASGVAAALSKTGDGNVLLVDMNGGQGATHSFYKGKPGCGLSTALEPEARVDAQVQENLYVMTLRPSDSPGAAGDTDTFNKLLPSRFNKIMPELKASDYDYIIFDMPPVTPTSVTPRLASNMDMVLLMLESEKTGQQVAIRAGELLAEARVKAAVVLNKCRQHVPALLSQEM